MVPIICTFLAFILLLQQVTHILSVSHYDIKFGDPQIGKILASFPPLV